MLGEIVKRIFNPPETNAIQLVRRTWIDSLEANDKAERDEAQRLVDWYNRDREKILEYLKAAAHKTFDAEIDETWQWPVINAVPRTIKRLSQAYKDPPKRELIRKGEVLPANAAEYDHLKRLYEYIDPDARLKDADRFAKLLNTIHIEVVPRYGAIDWDIHLRPKVTVLQSPDNYLDFIKFAHFWEGIDPEKLQKYSGWIYWTEDEHFMIRDDTLEQIGMSQKDGKNPYRDANKKPMIPIVTIRMIEQGEYWGQFGSDLVDAIQAMNIQLANLWENGFLLTAGNEVDINMGVKSGQTIKRGPRNPQAVDNVTKDDVLPQINYSKPEADIKEMMDLIDWFQKSVGATYGLPPSAWALEETRLSGIAKFIDNIELLENREDEITQWQRIERNLFNKSRIVFNQFAKLNGQEPIPDDLSLRVTFPRPSFPETPAEKAQRLIAERSAGINSPVEYFMEKYGESREEALARAKRIAEDNAAIAKFGTSNQNNPTLPNLKMQK